MNLLWWEHEQLLDHLASRKDIWSSSREHMWLRQHTYDDDTPCLGLAISPPTRSGPFRQYLVRAIPLTWDTATCEAYLDNLVNKWTDYATRRRYTHFLQTELGLDSARAAAGAIGLCAVDQGELTDPDGEPLPSNRQLWPDVIDFAGSTRNDERLVKTFGISGGGWVTIRLAGGMLHVRMSLRDSGRFGGGYGSPFVGFIRPRDGNVPLAAATLFGNDISCAPRTDSELQQIKLFIRGGDGEPEPAFVLVPLAVRRPEEPTDPDELGEDLPEPE